MQPLRRQPLPKPAFGSSPNLQVSCTSVLCFPIILYGSVGIPWPWPHSYESVRRKQHVVCV